MVETGLDVEVITAGCCIDVEVSGCAGNPGTGAPLLVVTPSLVTMGEALPVPGPKLVTFPGAGNGGTPATDEMVVEIAACVVVTTD